MMLPSDLPLGVKIGVTADEDNRTGSCCRALPWLSSVWSSLVAVPLAVLWMARIARMELATDGHHCWCRNGEDSGDAGRDESDLMRRAAGVVLTGLDRPIVDAEEDDRMAP
ncbi:hypothetical protein ACLOJK_009008 [Asimina triloba]